MEKSNNTIKLFIASDSTAATNTESTYPQAGWGQMIGKQLSSSTEVHNYATNGRSTKSFIDEGRLDAIESKISKGDFLIIQFGHNDEKKDAPERYTEPFSTYKDNLKKYINVAKNAGATPVLATPVSRRLFNSSGEIVNTYNDYCTAMAEVAKETQTILIDLCQKSKDLLEGYGDENSKKLFMIFGPGEYPNYPEGLTDNTHFNYEGAKKIASLVVEGLLENNINL